MRRKLWMEESNHVTYLPYGDLQNRYGEQPLKWLFENFEGDFTFVNMENNCTKVQFKHEEDMQLFMLTWGEYLWSEEEATKYEANPNREF